MEPSKDTNYRHQPMFPNPTGAQPSEQTDDVVDVTGDRYSERPEATEISSREQQKKPKDPTETCSPIFRRVVDFTRNQIFGGERDRKADHPEGDRRSKIPEMLSAADAFISQFGVDPLKAEGDPPRASLINIEVEGNIKLEALYVKNTGAYINTDITKGEAVNGVDLGVRNKEVGDRPIAVLFPGSHANAFHWAEHYLEPLFYSGLDILVVNRRGFGNSSGEPSPDAMKHDSLEVMEYLKSEGYKPENTTVIGFSMGGVEACHVAANYELNTVVVDRAFSKLSDVAKLKAGLGTKTAAKTVANKYFEADNAAELQQCKAKNAILISSDKDYDKKLKHHQRNLGALQNSGIDQSNIETVVVTDLDHENTREVMKLFSASDDSLKFSTYYDETEHSTTSSDFETSTSEKATGSFEESLGDIDASPPKRVHFHMPDDKA